MIKIQYEDSDYIIPAILLNTKVDALKKLDFYSVSLEELQKLREGQHTKPYHVKESRVYAQSQKINEPLESIGVGWLLFTKEVDLIPVYRTKIEKYKNAVNNVLYHINEIKNNENSISGYMRELNVLPISFISFNESIKYAKKFGIFASLDDNYYILKFPKIKLGNDMEGYLKYRSITLYLERTNWKLKRIIYDFGVFQWDTLYCHPPIPLHPHITKGGVFCMGNRKAEFLLYTSGYAYPAIYEVLNATLRNYTNEENFRPYRSVKEIGQTVRLLGKIMPRFMANVLTNPTAYGERLPEVIHEVYCRECRNEMFLLENNYSTECRTPHCRRNPNANINCSFCDDPMVFNSSEWNCLNPRCRNSVNYIRPPAISPDDTIGCLICGQSLTNEEHLTTSDLTVDNEYYYCADHINFGWQYNAYNGRNIDAMSYPFSFTNRELASKAYAKLVKALAELTCQRCSQPLIPDCTWGVYPVCPNVDCDCSGDPDLDSLDNSDYCGYWWNRDLKAIMKVEQDGDIICINVAELLREEIEAETIFRQQLLERTQNEQSSSS